jgi:DNA-binding transcriptional regulator YiaG
LKSPIYQRNTDIREARGKIPMWVIAERLGIHENTLRHWLRQELPHSKKSRILRVIEDIKRELMQQEA